MLKFATVTVALVAATLSAGVAAADPKQEAGTAVENTTQPNAAPSDQRRYCVEYTVTGSRIRQRDCKTRTEWLKEGFDPLNP